MKKLFSIGIIGICLFAVFFDSPAQTNSASAPANSSIAVSIVYDGSGSMMETVPGADNRPAPKYQIANKAVDSIVRQLLAFSQDKHTEVQVGLVYFVGGKIQQAIPLAPLTLAQGERFAKWTQDFKSPNGGTPLGRAIQEAQTQLSASPSSHRHILVITDGVSNSGIAPQKVVRELHAAASPIPVYFVAFDVAASVFEPVKAAGATVVSASNEAQLNVQLNAILGQKILLEAE